MVSNAGEISADRVISWFGRGRASSADYPDPLLGEEMF